MQANARCLCTKVTAPLPVHWRGVGEKKKESREVYAIPPAGCIGIHVNISTVSFAPSMYSLHHVAQMSSMILFLFVSKNQPDGGAECSPEGSARNDTVRDAFDDVQDSFFFLKKWRLLIRNQDLGR